VEQKADLPSRQEAEHEEGEVTDQQVPDPHAKKSLSGGTADPAAVPPDDGPRVSTYCSKILKNFLRGTEPYLSLGWEQSACRLKSSV
jgi:hypothetical protein